MTYATVAAVCLITVLLAVFGLQLTRSTGDFYVASRRVSPLMNASAVAGEYLSAASFLGVVGLIYGLGSDGLWLPVGYTAGFIIVLLFVAAPLRRSGAYTLPDFVVLRFRSAALRRITAATVVMVGWLYVVPQLYGAALVTDFVSGAPSWAGPLLVASVVLMVVLTGGMRSVTVSQAVQYWVKLAALFIPAVFIAIRWSAGGEETDDMAQVLLTPAREGSPLIVVSLLVALCVGAVGLPHVLVRFYTNSDGQAARRTAATLTMLVGAFYIVAVFLGLAATGTVRLTGESADTAVLQLPEAILQGVTADVMTAILVGGAFAAFLSTTSGLVVSVSGVISQEMFNGSVAGFRIGTVIAVAVPLLLMGWAQNIALAGAVAMVFTFAASTVAPVVVLGIWWSRISTAGAVAGMITGALTSTFAIVTSSVMVDPPVLMQYPGLWAVPVSFAVVILVSLMTQAPASTESVLTKLHMPDGTGDSSQGLTSRPPSGLI